MRRKQLLFFFLLPALVWAQDPPKALLWKIDGQGLSRPSYVVGTVHSRDARAFVQVPQLLRIVEGQDAVAGELDLTEGVSPSMRMARNMMMPDGVELADLYTKRKLKKVEEALKARMGPMALMVGRIKPFFLMGMLSEMEMRADSAMVLDQYLEVKAQEMGKEVVGVETMEEQMEAVDNLSLQAQADLLYEMVRNDFYRGDMEKMLDAYAEQDLDRLTRIASMGGLSEGMTEHLLVGRNRVMAQRLDSLMQEGRTFLFALGAAHLPGEEGVLERLRAMGYAVEPVPAEVPELH